jgi:IPT/TIG domain
LIDALVLLTPILLLGVVSLLGFVGCQLLYGVALPPSIDANQVIPDSGPSVGGTPVKIFGSNLTGVDRVTFGGIDAASFTVISDTEIDAVTLPSPAGPVNIVVTKTTGGDAGSSDPLPFTYVAIGFVQTASAAQNTSPPLSVPLNNTVKGNLLIAAVSYAGPAAGSVSVSDDMGNAFTLGGSGPWLRQSRIFYLSNIPGGNITITATGAGGASGPCSMCISEYSGADPTSAAVYGFSTGRSPNTGTAGVEIMQGVAVSPAQSGDIVYVVVFAARNTALLAGPGFISHGSTITSLLVEDSAGAVTAAQPVATDDTTGGSFVQWVVLAVAIKA